MGYQVKLTGYRPSARDDGNPWVEAEVSEAPTVAGTRSVIDLRTLTPVDADPMDPAVRNIQTYEGTAPHGLWYWVAFVDATGGRQVLGPSFNMAEAFMPTPEQMRQEFALTPWDDWGYPAPEEGEVDPLEVVLRESQTEAYGYFRALVTAEPDERAPLIRRAMKMLIVYNAGSMQPELLETALDFDMLSAMSAAGYSETRRGLVRPNPQVLHPWPALNRLIDFVLHFGGDTGDDAPGLVQAPACPPPYEVVTRQRHGRRYPYGVTEPLWPQPWVTNANGTP